MAASLGGNMAASLGGNMASWRLDSWWLDSCACVCVYYLYMFCEALHCSIFTFSCMK